MDEVPPHVTSLAEQRARARTDRDHARADALRDKIEAEGWLVRDTGDGFELVPRPPFEVWPTVSSVPLPGAPWQARRTEWPERAAPADSTGSVSSVSSEGSATAVHETAASESAVSEAGASRATVRESGARNGATVRETAPAPAPATAAGETAGESVGAFRGDSRKPAEAAGRSAASEGSSAAKESASGRPSAAQEPPAGREPGAGARRSASPDAGRLDEVSEPAAHPGRLDDLDAGRVADTEVAPDQKPEGSELVGRVGEHEGRPERMLFSQLLWDASLSVSRLDEEVTPIEDEEPVPPTTVTVGLVVDGWPEDLRECVRALVARTDAKIIALDLGNVDGAGGVLEELAEEYPRRIETWHVAETPHWRGGSAGWGESRTKLLKLDASEVHVVMETSTILDGDAITPLVRELKDDVVAAGWKGVNPGEDTHQWHEAGPGEVKGVLGHLFAVRRDAALEAGGFSRDARYYRNADLEFSLLLPGTVVALGSDLPVHQERHRGYHDVDPGYRDKESRRTYDRVLGLLRAT
ncbi:hypothetical protein [Streptosporangium sp. NPDC051022]|uniref:CysS/YqeB C-terminal domain-containing protein n=1 Tax=Streptosporangium sp. NPDC051022 TaxID=3155752 RepID=UPI003423135A